jgi:hypothetical protein
LISKGSGKVMALSQQSMELTFMYLAVKSLPFLAPMALVNQQLSKFSRDFALEIAGM